MFYSRHGQFRPFLPGMIKKNFDERVRSVSTAAFALHKQNPTDVIATINKLAELHGVGAATASLILAIHDPDNVIFFSDEIYVWLMDDGGGAKPNRKDIKYNVKEYKVLYDKSRALMAKLRVSLVDIEMVAYVIAREAEQDGPDPKVAQGPIESTDPEKTGEPLKTNTPNVPKVGKRKRGLGITEGDRLLEELPEEFSLKKRGKKMDESTQKSEPTDIPVEETQAYKEFKARHPNIKTERGFKNGFFRENNRYLNWDIKPGNSNYVVPERSKSGRTITPISTAIDEDREQLSDTPPLDYRKTSPLNYRKTSPVPGRKRGRPRLSNTASMPEPGSTRVHRESANQLEQGIVEDLSAIFWPGEE